MKTRTLLHALGLLCCLNLSLAAQPSGKVVRIVVPAGPESSVTQIAVERLQQYGSFTPRIVHAGESTAWSGELTLIVGEPTAFPELREPWQQHMSAKPDSYLIKTLSRNPVTLAVSGVNQRGTLYAAYHLADLIKAGANLTELDIFRQPRIAERFVSFGATTYGRRHYVPEQHWKTLKELPAFGYNGIVIYPGGGTPIGRRASPVVEAKDGSLSLDPENTKQWKGWFAELAKYDLDLLMTIPPIIPPGYSNKAISEYYAGGARPDGYLPALQAHFRRYLELLTTAHPELRKFMFNSTEGATFGRNERFFGHPDLNKYSNETYLKNNEEVMQAYFDVLADFFKADRSQVYFWTHSFGLTSDGIAKMREVLFRNPWVTIIEDDYWNNNLWPMDLPSMAYLPPALRERVSKQNPYALFQIAPDGEYYGGGSIPNAYPGSHIRSSKDALRRNARMVIQRLDLHDRTPYGTAFGTMKIVPYAASQYLWDPTPADDEIWNQWASTRFGSRAAPHVIRALKESHTVLIDGYSGDGIDLLGVGSEFNTRLWTKDKHGVSRFHLFGKPGRRLVNKGPNDVILSEEFTAWQTDTHSIEITDFRHRQENAGRAIERGLAQVELAKPHLAPADYEMLHDVFIRGGNVLRVVRLLGEAAYATNLVLENFDNVENPRQLHQKALAELEAYLDEGKLIPEMTKNIRAIAKNYRELGAQ